MTAAHKKAASPARGEAAYQEHHTANRSDTIPKAQGTWTKIRCDLDVAVWRTSYMLEESRQHHAALGHFWREAGFCILLALMRIARLA